jgi:hypothetical protein
MGLLLGSHTYLPEYRLAVGGEAMKKDFFDTLNGKPAALPPKKQSP